MGIKALAFDIDGTLYPEGKFYARCIPLVIRSPLLFSAYYRARKEIRKDDSYDPPISRELARRVLGYFHCRGHEEQVQQMESLLHRRFIRHWDRLFQGIKPFAYVKDALDELADAGYTMAALSDFPVGNKLDVLNLSSFFSVSFSAEETGYLKPSGVPFEELIRRVELSPGEVLYVGNSRSKDVLGALNAGLISAWFYHRPGKGRFVVHEAQRREGQPHLEFSSYRVFPEAVRRLQEVIGSSSN